MGYNVFVGYKSTSGSHFDTDYYINKHMALVEKSWSDHGLTNWSVSQIEEEDAPYNILASLVFKDQASFQKAAGDGAAVFSDVPNFTDLKPVLFHGKDIGSHK
jgi:uncharacterized protein (TIGR02118 family)